MLFRSIPGVTAFTTALVGSGMDTTRFVFEGFLHRDKKLKRERLEKIKKDTRTLIFYESPHRLKESLKLIYEILGNRNIVVARELTKKFEEYIRGSVSEIILLFEEKEVRGELVLILEGYTETTEDLMTYDPLESIESHVERYMNQGLDKKEAMKKVAKERKIKKSDIYAILLESD